MKHRTDVSTYSFYTTKLYLILIPVYLGGILAPSKFVFCTFGYQPHNGSADFTDYVGMFGHYFTGL